METDVWADDVDVEWASSAEWEQEETLSRREEFLVRLWWQVADAEWEACDFSWGDAGIEALRDDLTNLMSGIGHLLGYRPQQRPKE